MGFIYQYETAGLDSGTWFTAVYPLGATRNYRTEAARAAAVSAYVAAIRATGGSVVIIEDAAVR